MLLKFDQELPGSVPVAGEGSSVGQDACVIDRGTAETNGFFEAGNGCRIRARLGGGGGHSFSACRSDIGKLVIIITIVVGRFRPVLIGLFAVQATIPARYRYPEARVLIG